MTSTLEMLETYPRTINLDRAKLAQTIDLLAACATTCTACADACLSEKSVADLTKCVRTNLDCADICGATVRVLSRHTEYDANITRALLEACAVVCRTCADECERHAEMHDHCRICAEACRAAEETCQVLLGVVAS